MPAMIMEAGGDEFSVGALTAIMVGLPLVSQLLFAGFLHTRTRKKPFLLLGINMRVAALALAAVSLAVGSASTVVALIFVAMTIFAVSGAFAGVSYTDIVGALVVPADRRTFFVRKQLVFSTGVLCSALITRFLLGTRTFPTGYVILFVLAAAFLLIASGGFWVLKEPVEERPAASDPRTPSLLETYARLPAPPRYRGESARTRTHLASFCHGHGASDVRPDRGSCRLSRPAADIWNAGLRAAVVEADRFGRFPECSRRGIGARCSGSSVGARSPRHVASLGVRAPLSFSWRHRFRIPRRD